MIPYTVVDGKAAPFGINHFASQEEAMGDAIEVLKATPADWVEVQDDQVEQYILDHATNRWSPADDAKRRGLGGLGSAPLTPQCRGPAWL